MGQVSWEVPLDVQVEGWDAWKRDIKGREPPRRRGMNIEKAIRTGKRIVNSLN